MPSQLELLKRVNELDGEVAQSRRQAAAFKRKLDAVAAAALERQQAHEAKTAQVKGGSAKLRAREAELADTEALLKKLASQQAAVTTARAAEALAHEEAAARQKASVLEEQILKGLEAEEAAYARLAKNEEALAAAAVADQAERTRLQGLADEAADLAGDFGEERIRWANQLDPDWQFEIDALAKRHAPGEALAALDGENCGGCGGPVTLGLAQRLRHSHAHDAEPLIERCPQCGRILMADPR